MRIYKYMYLWNMSHTPGQMANAYVSELQQRLER